MATPFELLDEAAAEIYGAIESAWSGALATFKADIAALFTKPKLLQWVLQFPFSLGTIAAAVVVAGLDLVRHATQALPQGLAQGLVRTVVKSVPVGKTTIVLTQRQAIQGAMNLFTDGMAAVGTAETPLEVLIGKRIRSSGAWLKMLKALFGNTLDAFILGKAVKALVSTIIALVRFGVSIGALIGYVGLALYFVQVLTSKPNTYFKPLSQSKGRAWVTTRDFQRV